MPGPKPLICIVCSRNRGRGVSALCQPRSKGNLWDGLAHFPALAVLTVGGWLSSVLPIPAFTGVGFWIVLGMEPKVLCITGKYSTPEPHAKHLVFASCLKKTEFAEA